MGIIEKYNKHPFSYTSVCFVLGYGLTKVAEYNYSETTSDVKGYIVYIVLIVIAALFQCRVIRVCDYTQVNTEGNENKTILVI